MYLIYAARSPSGKMYVGLTQQLLARRWAAHVTRAATAMNHPLYQAIAKYGAKSFEVFELQTGLTKTEAEQAERYWIACLATVAPGGYNVSEGGESDGAAGGQRFAEMLRDPEWRAEYVRKLKGGIKDRPFNEALVEAALRWRQENPRTAWAQSYRASRVAAGGKPRKDPRFGPWGRLVIRSEKVRAARRAYFAQGRMKTVWAQRDEAVKADLGAKIGASVAAFHKSDPERTKRMLAETRSKIDRAHQGARASQGLSSWWKRLKADPEAYRAHMAKRRQTRKQNARPHV